MPVFRGQRADIGWRLGGCGSAGSGAHELRHRANCGRPCRARQIAMGAACQPKPHGNIPPRSAALTPSRLQLGTAAGQFTAPAINNC